MPTRSLVLGCALLSGLALGACKTEELHPIDPNANRLAGTFDPLHRNVDMLFLIDDSSGMALAQDNLIRNFPTFMAALQVDPAGLPNMHIAVVSSDMGAGDGSIPGCDSTRGKNGIFRYNSWGTCTTSNLDPAATFISNVDGVANYAGNIEDVFGCIARLGESGCEFGHHFAAITRALGVDDLGPQPLENQGFLRTEAALAIVMLTNKDDCSASLGYGPNGRIPLFDTASNYNMAAQLGPPTHFRCNEFGHLCAQAPQYAFVHPDRNAPGENVNALVTYDVCTSNDQEGFLLGAADAANRIKSLKPDPSRVVFASIGGYPSQYVVHWNAPSTTDTTCGSASCPWPEITHACTAADGRVGDPGVRNVQFAGVNGINSAQLSVCDDFGRNFEELATIINRVVGPTACIVESAIGFTPAGQPDCKVGRPGPDGVIQAVPSCTDSGGLAPCWQFMPVAADCPGLTLGVLPDPNWSGSGLVSYSCARGP